MVFMEAFRILLRILESYDDHTFHIVKEIIIFNPVQRSNGASGKTEVLCTYALLIQFSIPYPKCLGPKEFRFWNT